jgi:hypothetical protein
MYAWHRTVVAVLVLLGALDASAQSVLEGNVVGITDGDTLTLLVDRVDMRSLQAYLGHASITHTVRYTEMSPTRFKGIWRG